MSKARSGARAPIAVIFGESDYLRAQRLRELLDRLLPADVDRGVALAEYEGLRSEEQGGPTVGAVFDDLNTLPFLADRRVVVIRDADRFVTSARERLEAYLAKPAATGTLVLVCRSFPKTTRLYKAAAALGGELIECGKLSPAALERLAAEQATARGVRLDAAPAKLLVEQVGGDPGRVVTEVEKLCLYAGERKAITADDIELLTAEDREQHVFGALDAAAQGRATDALAQWQQACAREPKAVFMAVAGMALKARSWLAAHRAQSAGRPMTDIASLLRCWGRPDVAATILRRVSERKARRLLAAIADLDAQAKVGARSIETGVERILLVTSAGP